MGKKVSFIRNVMLNHTFRKIIVSIKEWLNSLESLLMLMIVVIINIYNYKKLTNQISD